MLPEHRDRYEKLGVHISDGTVTNGEIHDLSKGCQRCKDGTWLCLFMGQRCNADCWFCSRPERNRLDTPGHLDRIVSQIYQYDIRGVSYSGGEPLLYIDKIVEIAEQLDVDWQWCYTNGLRLNKETAERLRAAGINEIRLNLAATWDMSKLEWADTVEVPSIPEVYDNLITKGLIHEVAKQVSHINLAELYVRCQRARELVGDCYFFEPLQLLSPRESREITVKIFEYIVEHEVPIIANDCSNDAKWLCARRRRFPNSLIRI